MKMAEIVPNMKALKHTCEDLPMKDQRDCHGSAGLPALTPPQNELTQPIPISLQLEPGVPTSEYDMLNKVDLLGCTKWDPKDQQEVK